MNFYLEFEMNNAAFDGDWRIEAKRIMEEVGNKIENLDLDDEKVIKDINGNTVGHFGAWE